LIPGFSLLALTHALMATVALLHFSFPSYVAVYLGVYASQALTGGNMLTLGSDLAPPQARGLFFGVYNLISQTGSTLSPLAFAALATAYDYPASFVFLSLMSLGAALVLGLLVPDPVGRAARRKVTAQTASS
jgi:MFS family permease